MVAVLPLIGIDISAIAYLPFPMRKLCHQENLHLSLTDQTDQGAVRPIKGWSNRLVDRSDRFE